MHTPPIPGVAGNRSAKVRKIIGDDYYDLKLSCDGLIEFQERTGVGPFFAFNRMTGRDPTTGILVGDFRVEYVLEAIRIGLNGGGMNPVKSVKLVDRYIREGFIMDYVEVAGDVLFAALFGPAEEPLTPDEEPEDDEMGEPKAEVSPTPSPASNGPISTATAEPPAAL